MAGTRAGGLKTAEILKKRNPDYYRQMGWIGGLRKVPKGFAIDNRTFIQRLMRRPTRAQLAGRRGGTISRRGKREYTSN